MLGFVGDNLLYFQMTKEEKKEMEQEISDWIETHGDPEGNLKDDDGGAEKEKEVINVEAEEGKKRKQMWDHFTKIFEEGQLVKAKCKYCRQKLQHIRS
jgi:hypothetical protein